MIECANGLFNPRHVTFIGMDEKRAWRKDWVVTVMLSSGNVLIETYPDKRKAELRLAAIRQQISTSGKI